MGSPRHETALRYAALGIPVFPCVVGGKEPITKNGFYDATVDMATVERWWTAADYNIGMVPESAGWCAVDIDDPAEWHALGHDKPATYTVGTPSGGLHLYYAGSLPSTVKKLAPNIDTRGRGSYVLVPPSQVNGREYTVLDARTPAPLPEWITKAIGSSGGGWEAPENVVLDDPETIAWYKHYVIDDRARHGRPEEHNASDRRTHAIIGVARDGDRVGYSLTPDTIFDILHKHWCPHFEADWLETKTAMALLPIKRGYANEPGCGPAGGRYDRGADETPASWREYVNTLPPEPKLDFPAPVTLREAQSVIYPPLEWIWNNRFIAGLPNLLTGDVKMGKTTLAKNLAVAVAAGIPLLGAETRQMPVVLLLGEDLAGPVRDDLMRIAQEMQAPDNALDHVSFLSVVSDHIPGGSWLATIEDKHGTVSETDFMRHLIEAGHIPRGCLFIIDPLAKFVLFNQHDPTSARALHDRFCEPLCRSLGITILINDHPSAASIERKDHAAGSKHFKAPFAAFATLLDKGKAGKTQHRLLDFREMRYAAGEAIDVYRGESPVFSLHPYGADDPKEVEMRVYEHVKERLDMGEHTGKDGHASYGPAEIGQALCIDEGQVKVAIDTCIRAEYLRWVARKGGGDGKIPAHLELGHVTPLAQPMRY